MVTKKYLAHFGLISLPAGRPPVPSTPSCVAPCSRPSKKSKTRTVRCESASTRLRNFSSYLFRLRPFIRRGVGQRFHRHRHVSFASFFAFVAFVAFPVGLAAFVIREHHRPPLHSMVGDVALLVHVFVHQIAACQRRLPF